MDFYTLSPQGITDLIENQFPQKLTSSDISRDNIIFYVTTGSQFNKLIDKCGVDILNKPCLSGDYYVNEVIRSKLLPAIVNGSEYASMYHTFYSIIVNTYGISQVTRCSNERKETSMHLLRKAIDDEVGGKEWKSKLEDIYKLAIGKLPKRMISTLLDVDGYNVYGELVLPVAPPTVATPQVVPTVATPQVAPTVATPQVAPTVATPQVAPTVATPQVAPTTLPAATVTSAAPTVFEDLVEIPSNPFSSKVESPRGVNNIVIIKGYEYHFIPSTLRGHLKINRK